MSCPRRRSASRPRPQRHVPRPAHVSGGPRAGSARSLRACPAAGRHAVRPPQRRPSQTPHASVPLSPRSRRAVLPFSAFQLQLRAFYAMADSRTPAFVMCGVAAVNIVSGLVLANVLPDRERAVALALSFALAYAFGAAVCFRLLRRRLGRGRRTTYRAHGRARGRRRRDRRCDRLRHLDRPALGRRPRRRSAACSASWPEPSSAAPSTCSPRGG